MLLYLTSIYKLEKITRGSLMPSVKNTPKELKPYVWHGVGLDAVEGDGQEQVYGDCPFCGREGKFAIQVSTGLWRCLVCNEGSDESGKFNKGGNIYTFLRLLWRNSHLATNNEDYEWLMKHRGILKQETLERWGVCKSILGGDWIIPGYGPDGKLNNLYRYIYDKGKNRWVTLATPGLNQCLHKPVLLDNDPNAEPQDIIHRPERIMLCEGPWDAMVLWETLRVAKQTDEGIFYAVSEEHSMLKNIGVMAVPGCNTFREQWLNLFSKQDVVLMYDSDHPREFPEGSGKFTAAGRDNMKNVAQALARAEEPPSKIEWLEWGPEGFDPALKSGWDVRDYLMKAKTPEGRVGLLRSLLQKIKPIPADWVEGRTEEAAKTGGTQIDLLPCSSYATLQISWRKAMRWIEGLDRGLACMLAAITSVKAQGDQLWLRVIGPAACGKSTLCEALS